MPRNNKKFFHAMMIICVIIALIAFSVAITAIAMQEYITAIAMLIVTGWQIINYRKWKKNV